MPGMRVTCRFNTREAEGVVVDQNRATCVMPTFTEAEGWVDFEVSTDGGPFYWEGMFYVGEKRQGAKVFVQFKS